MLEIAFHGTSVKKYAVIWIKIATILCCINSLALFFFNSKGFSLYTMLFPFFNCGIINIVFLFFILFNLKKLGKDENSQYIREKKHGIWRRLHPVGKYSHNFFAYWAFISGKYDNGSDERLNTIKCNEKEKVHFILWVNLLTPIFWTINLIIIRTHG